MKRVLSIVIVFLCGCSDKPVDMDAVLYDRSGQYITGDNYSNFFFYNQKVYNGPAFNRFRSGEKREQGMLKNGFKSGVWTGWNKKGEKNIQENTVEVRLMGSGSDITQMEKKNMKVFMNWDSRLASGLTMMKGVEKI